MFEWVQLCPQQTGHSTLCVEMGLSADAALWFVDRLSAGCSAGRIVTLGLRSAPKPFPRSSSTSCFFCHSWELEMSDMEQKWISGPCCMLIPPKMSAEGKSQKMSGSSGYGGGGDAETLLAWTFDGYIQ